MDDIEYIFSGFVKKGFKHVYAIERQALGWLCHDPSRRDFFTHILPAKYEHDVMLQYRINNPTHTILGLEVKAASKGTFPRLGMLSCVGVMQYILAVNWPFVHTPYRLYSKLTTETIPHIKLKD